jgi:hypothetical protein
MFLITDPGHMEIASGEDRAILSLTIRFPKKRLGEAEVESLPSDDSEDEYLDDDEVLDNDGYMRDYLTYDRDDDNDEDD